MGLRMSTLSDGSTVLDGITRLDVKICGIKTRSVLDAALEGGATHVGLVFFAPSPRNVTLEDAARLAALARQHGRAQVVALVVDATDSMLRSINEAVSPDIFQLHGKETPARVAEIKQIRWQVWKAVPVGTAGDAERAVAYKDLAGILFDAKAPKGSALPGGNGHAFDWRVLEGVRGRFPYMLSGGLNQDNVAEAISATGCAGIDVSSSVESAPGFKDPELILRFLRAVSDSSRGQA